MASGRRFLTDIPRLAGRSWEDVAPQLEGWLKRIWESESDGIPAGYNENLPEAIEVGSVGAEGDQDSGWAASDHEHPVPTGSPALLANANVEGGSDSVPRLDHQHKRDVRVKAAGVDVATRNALDFRDNTVVQFTITDDPGNDEVDVLATLSSLYKTFPAGGTVKNSSGIAAPDQAICFIAPFACDVVNVRAMRRDGTGATVNMRKNGTLTHLASDLSLTAVDTVYDGGTVQNVSYAEDDFMEILLQTAVGTPTHIAVTAFMRRTG